jgi:hypothetical protein
MEYCALYIQCSLSNAAKAIACCTFAPKVKVGNPVYGQELEMDSV